MPAKQDAHKTIVREEIKKNSSLNNVYFVMNTLSTIVACYGLLENSSAVVIGAMIIALLLGPITGVALALSNGDNLLLRNSISSEICGVVNVLLIAFVIGTIHQDVPLGSEILARTTPNILDMVIALAGGAAGAYATISQRLSASFVGVAIATALVPPLSVCGILAARGEFNLAGGAFLLFFTNFVGIQVAASFVLLINGYHGLSIQTNSLKYFFQRHIISLLIVFLLIAILSVSFQRTLSQQLYEDKTRKQIQSSLKQYPGAHLAELHFFKQPPHMIIYAIVRTPVAISPQAVSKIQNSLPSDANLTPEVHVRSVLIKEATSKEYVYSFEENSLYNK